MSSHYSEQWTTFISQLLQDIPGFSTNNRWSPNKLLNKQSCILELTYSVVGISEREQTSNLSYDCWHSRPQPGREARSVLWWEEDQNLLHRRASLAAGDWFREEEVPHLQGEDGPCSGARNVWAAGHYQGPDFQTLNFVSGQNLVPKQKDQVEEIGKCKQWRSGENHEE